MAKKDETFSIVGLEIENFKRLSAVSIRPDGSLIEITGRNAQGKSSVLDAIWAALAGKSVVPAVPVRRGAEKARIRLDLGELVITRTFTAQEDGGFTTSLSLENGDGAKFSKPQDILNGLYGELTLDPLEFERSKPAEQFEMLKRFVPGFDFDADARARKADYEKRTDVNRRAKDLRAQAAGIAVPEGATADEVDEEALTQKLADAADTNGEIDRKAQQRENFAKDTASLEAERAQLQSRVAEMTARIEGLGPLIASRRDRLAKAAPLAAKVDITATREELDRARQTNRVASLVRQREQLEEQAVSAENESAALTKAIEDRDAARQKAIAAADVPVPGLTFGDGEVLLDGLPFAQASDAERLRASVAIAMALKSKLRIVRIREGSRLDADAVAMVAQMAAERGCQVWMETVQSGRPAAIVIEDGARADLAQAAE